MSQLRVIADGRPLDDREARATWERFSAHMERHQGDFDGFASREGYTSARVDVVEGVPTLTLARGTAEPSGTAPSGRGRRRRQSRRRRGGSPKGRHSAGGKNRGGRGRGGAPRTEGEGIDIGERRPKRPRGSGRGSGGEPG